ncbi:MAG TPA: hypothetical protein VN193_17140 [Candidatus Angelobacter sp.]|jgi:hypothetical protein|nr:hypothetical protein [Candidatus Angelobacter sp.]
MHGDAKWERLGAATGILFVVLLMVSIFMVPQTPDVNAAPGVIASYYSDHRNAVLASAYLGGLAIPVFLWFLGSLFQALRRAEGEHARLSIVCLAGGIATATFALGMAIFAATLAWGSALQADGGAVRALFLLSSMSVQFIYFAMVAFVLAGSVLMIRTGVISRWIGEAGVVFAAVMLVGAASLAPSGAFQLNGGLTFAGLLAFALWVLSVSVRMVMLAWPRRAAVGAAPVAR